MSLTTVTIPDAFLIGTDQSITVKAVKDEAGALVTGATFTGTLYDMRGASIATGITFADQGGGDYKGALGNAVALNEDQTYRLIGVAVKDGKQLTLRITRKAKYVEG